MFTIYGSHSYQESSYIKIGGINDITECSDLYYHCRDTKFVKSMTISKILRLAQSKFHSKIVSYLNEQRNITKKIRILTDRKLQNIMPNILFFVGNSRKRDVLMFSIATRTSKSAIHNLVSESKNK